DANGRPAGKPRERRDAARLRARFGGEHYRRAAVDDATGVAGRDGSVLRERRRQLRERLDGRVGAHVIVAIDDRRSTPRLISTGTTSSANRPCFQASSARFWLR